MRRHVPGAAGYAAHATDLIARYEAISFDEMHRAVAHLFPPPPATVLDIGAGTGRDAASFARLGHRVVAVEPTAALRNWAAQHHRAPRIEWIDDALPELVALIDRQGEFDLVMLTAVWMHLDGQERRRAMKVVARLLAPASVVIFTLRHGAVPADRVMHAVTASETLDLAADAGLSAILEMTTPSAGAANVSAGVTWSRLAFRSPP